MIEKPMLKITPCSKRPILVSLKNKQKSYHARVRTDSGYPEIPSTMDENEGTRITAMMRDAAPHLGAVFAACIA